MTFSSHAIKIGWRIVIGAAIALVVITAVLSPLILNAADRSASISASVKEGNDVSACRAQSNAAVVAANTRLTLASSALLLAENSGLEEVAIGNQADLTKVAAMLPQLRSAVTQAGADLSKATSAYQVAADQSVRHPAAFLATCHS